MSRRLLRALTHGLLAVWLLAALAPTLSRALGLQRAPAGEGWVELCSAAGTQWVRWADADAEAPAPDSGAHDPLDACDLCVLAAERFAPLQPGALPLPGAPGVAPAPTDVPWALTRPADTHPSARGPPAV